MPEEIQVPDGLTLNSEEADQLNRLLDADEAADAASAKGSDSDDSEPGLNDSADQPPQQTKDDEGSTSTAEKQTGTQDTAKAEKSEDQSQKEDKTKSRYEKERERQDRSWQKINEEKDTLKKERDAIAAEKARVQAEQAEWEARRRQQEAAQPSFTAEDYERAAEKWENDGKYDLADQARAEAARLKQNPSQEALVRQRRAQEDFTRAQATAWSRAKAEIPEIMDKSSPVNAKLVAFLNAHPQVLQYTDGPYLAAVAVRDSIAASRVPELLKQVETMQGRIKELEQSTSFPGSGVPLMQRGEVDFASMSTAEQEKALEAELASLQ